MAYSEKQKQNILDKVCERIIEGESVRNILRDKHMPTYANFLEWMHKDPDKEKQYRKATESETYRKRIKCKANPKGSRAKKLDDYRRDCARKVNKKKFPNSSLYIIKITDKNLFKIGVSQNTHRRIKDIESSMPFHIEKILEKKVTNAYDLEKTLHEKYISNYIKSEWFKLSVSDIKECLKIVEKWEKEDQLYGKEI